MVDNTVSESKAKEKDVELYFKHHDLFVRVCKLIKEGKLELLKKRFDLIERQA